MITMHTTETFELGSYLELNEGVAQKIPKTGKKKWAWEAISGTRMCPYPSGSVHMDLGTPPGLRVSSGESFGNVGFRTEID